MSILTSGLVEVQEITLKRASYTMTVGSGTTVQIDTVAHNLTKRPFIDYMVSKDNSTFYDQYQYTQTGEFNIWGYCDFSNVYFAVQKGSPALTVYIKYRLYITEATI